jgi:phosphatidylglycerol:prolipoprotein diacylglycerol transferase
MYPTLLDFGPLLIKTQSLFNALAFLTTAFVFWRKTKEEHYSQDQAFDAFLLSSMVGLMTGRIGFVITHFSILGLNLWKWLDVVSHPGSSVLFGLLGASLYLYRHSGKQKWDQFEILDFWFLAVSAGLVLTSLGNFFAGVGFGHQTNLPWGMVFSGVVEKHHPAQIYAMLFFLGLYIYLNWVEYHYRTFLWYRAGKKTAQTGFLTSVFLLAVGGYLVVSQLFMPVQLSWWGVNLDLATYLLLMITGGLMLYLKSGRNFSFKLPTKKTSELDEDNGDLRTNGRK